MKRFFKTALVVLLVLALAVPAWAGESEDGLYASRLSDLARRLYDTETQPEILARFRSGESFTVAFNGPFNDVGAAMDEILRASAEAIAALELDHPELLWLNGNNDSVSGNAYALTLTVTPFFTVNWQSGGRSTYDDEAAVCAAVQEIAAEACRQGGPYEQLRYVHDWLTKHNEYNSPAASAGPERDYLPWTPLAALTDAGQPVCEGYAKAFKLICDALGYPCMLVIGRAMGGDHMWNQVRLNGQWYAVDVTFDDPTIYGVSGNVSGHESHDCFLVGANTRVDGASTFSDTHLVTGIRIPGTAFTVPPLADEAATSEGVSSLPPAPEDPAEPEQPGEPEPIRFADVDEYAYYAPAVEWAVGVGVTNGTKLNDENGKNWFSPDDTVKRGQAATFLWRAMGQPEPQTKENPFRDVVPGSYYEQAVLWAVENGITNGTGDGQFSPDAPVTRGQMLTFLWRTMGRPMETEPYEGKQWYSDAESWAYESGCLGDVAGSYSNGEPCPRCDVVYYLFQAVLLTAA